MALPDFQLEKGQFSQQFRERGITMFSAACAFIQNLHYGRISDRDKLDLVMTENRGTCSSKHGILARLCEENNHEEIELIAGIFLMSPETHVELTDFFKDKPYNNLPEMHCFFRLSTHDRYDFTSKYNRLALIEPKLVREQRIEPHQTGDWKEKIHQDYLRRWIARKPELNLSFDEIWAQREECIRLLS
ncbi:MAG: hypothetical protein RI922_2268 [Bacteroidota bacterium]|jgi:hypothetical protein